MKGATLSRIVGIADTLFPFELAESWDNSGVQVGDPEHVIESICFGLDPTPTTIRFAADRGCNLLITHHPLFMEPLRSVRADNMAGRTVIDAVRLGVELLSLHTNLDAAPGGLNDDLAQTLGLEEIAVPPRAACARTGRLPEPMRVTQFGARVSRLLKIGPIRIVSEGDPEVRRVFCAVGSGMGYLHEAMADNAELILTGDVKYHAAREALELGIPVIDAGHFGLEKSSARLMARRFRSAFHELGLRVECIECDREEDPYTTLPPSAWEG